MNLSEYKFEIMLIVIVLVLAIFWFTINFFDRKKSKSSHQFAPIDNNVVNMDSPNMYTVENFQNNQSNVSSPPSLPVNTPPAPSTLQNAVNSAVNNNTNKNELEKNLSVSAQNATLSLNNNSVADFNSLSLAQLADLKAKTRERGVLGLVTYDVPSDTLRIVSTKA
jgi:hypothetical protein